MLFGSERSDLSDRSSVKGRFSGLLENSSCLEVVQAVGGFDEAVDHDLGVAAAVGGIDSVTGVEVAEALKGRVIVGEELNKGAFELSGFRTGGARRIQPSSEVRQPRVVGTEQWKGPSILASASSAMRVSFCAILRSESPQ